jgi:hypothetical protein
MKIRVAATAVLLGLLAAWMGHLAGISRTPAGFSFLLYPAVFAWILTGGVHASPFNEHVDRFLLIATGLFWGMASYAVLISFGKWRATRGREQRDGRSRQWKRDSEVVKRLAGLGDVATMPRLVDHRAYFPTPADRARFIEQLRNKGFEIMQEGEGGYGKRPLSVDFRRSDPVVLEHIHPVAWELRELAASVGGDYDGWGCTVTK